MENKKRVLSLALVFLLSFLQVMTPISYVFADGMDNENIETVEEINESNNLGKEDNQEIENEVNLDVDLDNNDNSNLEIELDNNLEDEKSSKNELENKDDSNIVDKLQDPTFEVNNEENYFYETQESFMTFNLGRDISSEVVTSFEVDKKNIFDGEHFTTRLEFAGNNGGIKDIHSGDIIKIDWNKSGSGDVYFEGFSKEIPLIQDGHKIGIVKITPNGAVLTFLEIVEHLDNIKGYFEFEMQGRNVTATSEVDKKTGDISVGNKSQAIEVTKQESGTQSVFYYKTGNMDPGDTEHVQWWLNSNLTKSYLDDNIRIKDRIQGGQEIDLDSFSISVSGNRNEEFYGEDAIKDFMTRFPNSSISVDKEKGFIDVSIDREEGNLNSFIISYRTKITNTNQKSFNNNSKIWYKENGKDFVDGGVSNHSVKNVTASGGIEGAIKGEIKIFKFISGKEVGIPDVEFELIKDGKEVSILKTDKNGNANIKNLAIGKYLLKEISAPDWINFDPLNTEILEINISDEDD